MDGPLISVVIPCFNSSCYIGATLGSLAKQAFTDFEVIIVDDGSSDDSVTVARRALDDMKLHGLVMSRPPDLKKGVANCRNAGINAANGQWISFLDSDDLFFPEKLMNTVRLIGKFGTSCGAYFHAIREFEDGTHKILAVTSKGSYSQPEDIFSRLMENNIIATSTVTVKSDLLRQLGGFDCKLNGVEDYFLWLRLAKKTTWFYSGEMWTDYRIRIGSLMGGRQLAHYVLQNEALYQSARDIKEFSPAELKVLDTSLFGGAMLGYAHISMTVWGWGDFINGLMVLGKIGRLKTAVGLFRVHFKNLLLKKAHKYILSRFS